MLPKTRISFARDESYTHESGPVKAKLQEAARILAYIGAEKSVGRILCYYPGATNNPFQHLLYQQAFSHNVAIVPMKAFELPQSLENLVDGYGVDLHIHWAYSFFKGVSSKRGARSVLNNVRNRLTWLKAKNVRLIWTLHNIREHRSPFVKEELELRQLLADAADVIHIMNPDTVGLCAPYYKLDSKKVVQINHPNYDQIYPDFTDDLTARYELSFHPQDKVLVFFGAILPYKGIKKLISHFIGLRSEIGPNLKLMIAGETSDNKYLDEIRRLAAAPGIRLFDRRVSDFEMQRFFKAADVVICPYQLYLNSGVAVAAQSFGRKLVIPTSLSGSFPDSAYKHCYRFDDTEGVPKAVRAALQATPNEADKKALRKWRKSNNAEKVSDEFFAILRAKLRAG